MDEFTVKQLPFVTVMSRPCTASSANAAPEPFQAAAQPNPRQLPRPHSSMSFTASAPAAAAFSPKWTADKTARQPPAANAAADGRGMPPGPLPAKERYGSERAGKHFAGSNQPTVEAALFEENCVLRAAVSSLRGMITHERMLKKDVELQLDVLRDRCVEIEAAVEEAERGGKGGGKAWRTNSKKATNFGPLAPSSVMDPWAEEQRIMREREQRAAEKEQGRRERLQATRADADSHSKIAATKLHS